MATQVTNRADVIADKTELLSPCSDGQSGGERCIPGTEAVKQKRAMTDKLDLMGGTAEIRARHEHHELSEGHSRNSGPEDVPSQNGSLLCLLSFQLWTGQGTRFC